MRCSNNKHTISVVTICLNDANVEDTCKSVAEQDFKDFEWIVIDGGSNQDTLEILYKYRELMDVFVSEKDRGVYHAMNKGIARCKGDYIVFMNGGDSFFDCNSLSIAACSIGRHQIVYGNALFKNDKKDFIKNCPDKLPPGWFKNDSLPHQATYIQRDLFKMYGLYNEKKKIVSDLEKWIVFIEVNKCTYLHVDKILAIHNYNGISSRYDDVHLAEKKDLLEEFYLNP